jgi:signal transduction histidine kinase
VSRRIALTFAALIAALLVLAVVPLGVSITANERQSFRYDTISAAHQVSSFAEEYLADRHSAAAMDASLASSARRGDCAAIYGPDDALVAAAGCPAGRDPDAAELIRRARAADADSADLDGVNLRVSVPVGEKGAYAGTVVLTRSQDPLDDRIATLWTWLGLTGAGGLVLGVVLALRLARWVARPLHALGETAGRLGDGALDVRGDPDRGPGEVRALAATFNRMADRTQMLVHSHRTWVADVSHQLRTPLTALRLRLDVLAGESDGETAAELAGALDEIGRLSRLVDGLLAVARAESTVPRREPVDVGRAVAERVAAWEPVARERRISLEVSADGGAMARLGPGDLPQMLDNVLANALEVVSDAGRVRVEVVRADERILLRVVDDGPGMDDAAKQAAFHRFANPGPRGNGLGLAIVHRLASSDGGNVRLLDTPGGGLTVELELPPAARDHGGRQH